MNRTNLIARIILTTYLFSLGLSTASARADIVQPARKQDALKLYESQKQRESQKQKRLQGKIKVIEGELEQTKSTLIDTARNIQNTEQNLQNLNQEIVKLADQQATLIHKLENSQGSIANLILTLERIRRTPPQALILKPNAPYKTAQTVMVLKNILPSVKQKIESLKTDLGALETITETTKKKKETARQHMVALKSKKKKLEGLVAKRERLFSETQHDYQQSLKELAQISSKSKNLHDLVGNLEKQNQRSRTAYAARHALDTHQEQLQKKVSIQPNRRPNRAALNNTASQLPVSGILRISYQQEDRFGAESQGLTFEGMSEGLVVAPMNGIVRFAGPFQKYENIIILEHEKGYHSLVAGLEKIDTLVGQRVSVGEPLGRLKKTVNGDKPRLYYELRFNGKPVDPAQRFADLG